MRMRTVQMRCALLAERAFLFRVVAVPLGLNSSDEGISEVPLV